jgi:hypothetical protein
MSPHHALLPPLRFLPFFVFFSFFCRLDIPLTACWPKIVHPLCGQRLKTGESEDKISGSISPLFGFFFLSFRFSFSY